MEKTMKKVRFSLSTNIILALVLGVLCGIFFGEYCAGLHIFGDAFVKLLQMSILPFIVVSLISGLGSLSYDEAKELAITAGSVLLLFWAMVFAIILLMPLSFPSLKSASFFSKSVVEVKEQINFLDLFIPSNPFGALAKNVVPAVVLFSIAVGVALIGIKEKHNLVGDLSIFSAAFSRIARFVVNLTPIGVFAIAASTAGTMTMEEFGRLQVYFITYTVAAVLLTFWILPMLLTTVTPFKYKDVVGLSRDALVTGFTTGNLFIVLPVLIANCKELFEKYRLEQKKTESLVDIIVPVSFNFPNMGGLLILVFIPFAAWFSASAFSVKDYPFFVFSSLFSMFGGAMLALTFLLDGLRIPSDLFQLFIASKVLTDRFATLLAAMHLLIFALITICAIKGLLTIRWKGVLRYTVMTVVITFITIITTRAFFTKALEFEYTKYKSFVEMELFCDPVPAKVHKSLPPSLPHSQVPPRSRLAEIRERGFLRVGYFKDSLPFAFTNVAANLVGFDIEMAHRLARELDVSLEFVQIDRGKVAEYLKKGYCDTIMSGFALTTDRLQEMNFSVPYLDNTIAFVVKDHRRNDFSSREAVQSLKAPKIGIPNVPYYIAKIRNYLPQARLVTLGSPREFFRKRSSDLDAFAYSAEAGSAWTLIYPEYSVVVPLPDTIAVPLAYPTARGDREMVDFLNGWISLKKKDGTIEEVFNYWILGHGAHKKGPRWSVIRNVLHWVD
jgi:Na+/H+-dicarboxylate symporter/ABC-type amino acid transport substrate-binding protein